LRVGANIMAPKKAMKASKSKWDLKEFSGKEKDPWKAAVLSVQKSLKAKKREHPALFMLAAVGKQLYEAAQSLYSKAPAKKGTKRATKKKTKKKA